MCFKLYFCCLSLKNFRYETLVGARSDLNEIQQLDMMKLEKAKSNLVRIFIFAACPETILIHFHLLRFTMFSGHAVDGVACIYFFVQSRFLFLS